MRYRLPTALFLCALPMTAGAQVAQSVSQTDASGTTTTTTTVFSIAPQSGVSAADYVKLSADALNYQIAAATLATTRAQRDDVKAFARQIADHAAAQQKTLYAALNNADRKITRPTSALSSERKSNLDLLRKSPRAGFDNLFLTQQLDGMPAIWALQKGYGTDGDDPALRQVATTAAPMLEQDYGAAKSLTPSGITGG